MLSIMWIEEVEKADLEREKKMNKADTQGETETKGTYSVERAEGWQIKKPEVLDWSLEIST